MRLGSGARVKMANTFNAVVGKAMSKTDDLVGEMSIYTMYRNNANYGSVQRGVSGCGINHSVPIFYVDRNVKLEAGISEQIYSFKRQTVKGVVSLAEKGPRKHF